LVRYRTKNTNDGAGADVLSFEQHWLGLALSSERDYEIRFFKADGTTSLVFVTSCAGNDHARETAERMMKAGFAGFEVWNGQACVAKGAAQADAGVSELSGAD